MQNVSMAGANGTAGHVNPFRERMVLPLIVSDPFIYLHDYFALYA